MFYFLALSFVISSVFTTESVSEEYKPCLDKAGSSFCIKPHEKGMYRDETMKELMEEIVKTEVTCVETSIMYCSTGCAATESTHHQR
ncbi:hypothetical protein RB195_002900 [Necator americanus]|uniref:Uncharacterized protein n=1 Tax=Necator americanus TaxID=51031 RepID=A0ABR1DL64_NECAM